MLAFLASLETWEECQEVTHQHRVETQDFWGLWWLLTEGHAWVFEGSSQRCFLFKYWPGPSLIWETQGNLFEKLNSTHYHRCNDPCSWLCYCRCWVRGHGSSYLGLSDEASRFSSHSGSWPQEGWEQKLCDCLSGLTDFPVLVSNGKNNP